MKRIKHAKTDSKPIRTDPSLKDRQLPRIPIEPVIPDPRKTQTHDDAQVAAVGTTSKRGRPFEPGNKFGRGRPKGSCNKLSFSARQVIGREGPDLIGKMAEMGKQGNERMLCALVHKILPNAKDPPPEIEPKGKDDDIQEIRIHLIPAPPHGNDSNPPDEDDETP